MLNWLLLFMLCSLILGWHLVATGDVMKLDVEICIGSLLAMFCSLRLRWQLVATSDIILLDVELAIFLWLCSYVA